MPTNKASKEPKDTTADGFDDHRDPLPRDGQTLRTTRQRRFDARKIRIIGHEDIPRSSGASCAGGIGGAAGSVRSEGQCTRLATFMFKGGVYKTMTTILASSALASPPYNKKVLIVDADSQCNTTSFFYPEPTDWGKEAEDRLIKRPIFIIRVV